MLNPISCILCESQNIHPFYNRKDRHLGQREYRLCDDCGLVFLNPALRFGRDEEKERYDLHQNDPRDEGYRKFLSRLVEPLAARLPEESTGLDYGCGPGPTVSALFKEKGFQVFDYDPVYFPTKALLEKSYDFITCSEVAEHFYEPRKEFRQLNALLKGAGSYLGLMTQFFNPENDFSDWWYHRESSHVCFYQKKTFDWIAGWLDWRADYPVANVVLFSPRK